MSRTPHDKWPLVIVLGAPFTFRTFHGEDGWTREPRMFCPDRLVTFSMPAVAGLHHFEPATREIVL